MRVAGRTFELEQVEERSVAEDREIDFRIGFVDLVAAGRPLSITVIGQ